RSALGRKAVKVPRRLLAAGTVLAVGAMVAATAASAPTAVAQTTPISPGTARALAAQKATELVASRPAYLMASANDNFVQGKVVSSGPVQYVPYERTYSGHRVVGGDLVLVMNSAGQVVYNSVAMQHPIGNLSTTPKVSSGAAASTAKQ